MSVRLKPPAPSPLTVAQAPPPPTLTSFSSSSSYSLPYHKSPLSSALQRLQPPLPPSHSALSSTQSQHSQPSSSPLSSSYHSRDGDSELESAGTPYDDDTDTPSPSLTSLAHPKVPAQQPDADGAFDHSESPSPRPQPPHHASSSSLSSAASSSSSDSALSSVPFVPFAGPSASHPRRPRHLKPQLRLTPPLCLPPLPSRLTHFTLYETRQRFFLLASDQPRASFRLLKIDRSSSALSISEDSTVYTADEAAELIEMLRSANQSTGGFLSTTRAHGVLGFVRFLLGWYLYLVTDCVEVGRLGSHLVYAVSDVQLLQLTHPSVYEGSGKEAAAYKRLRTSEARYRALFLSLDLTRSFYFSHTYDLTRTLQVNMVAGGQRMQPLHAKSMYVWNHDLRIRVVDPSSPPSEDDPLRLPLLRTDWCVQLVHGYFEQTTLSVLGRPLTLTLLARRSRHFAGTRYLKRGINNRGHAANDVETEQLLHDRSSGDAREGQFVSYVTMRASIPVHWTQESNPIIAQPAIVMQKLDPLHRSTRLHLQDVWRRYGSPVVLLNLVKQSEQRKREVIIGTAYGEAVEFINQWIAEPHRLDYLAWDFKKVSKSKALSVIDELTVIAHWVLQRTGLFHSRPKEDARLLTAEDTRSLKPTRESLQEWGLHGLPQRVADRKHGGAREEVKEEREAGKSRDEERSARSGDSGGELTGMLTPLSAPFVLSSIREEKVRDGHDSGREFDAVSRSARFHSHSRSSSDDARGLSLASLSPSSSSSPNAVAASATPRRALVNHAFLQRGVCRANCVDSLDRTNAAAYVLGKVALGYQLHALSLIPSPVAGELGAIGTILLDMYERMGDAIALQYGGSQMHRQVKGDATPLPPPPSSRTAPALFSSMIKAKQPKELITSIVRHYQNSFQDNSKQDAMNLFLGLYRPWKREDGVQLWDMGSDYYLHNPAEEEEDDDSDGTDDEDDDDVAAQLAANYDDPSWWQRPILANERLQGPFAVPPSRLFPPATSSSLPTSSPTPLAPVTAKCLEADGVEPTSPSLSWLLAYGPLSVLTEFDALLTADAVATPRGISILGVEKRTEETTRGLEQVAKTLGEDPASSPQRPTPGATAASPDKARGGRSKRSRKAAGEAPPAERAAWEVEQSAEREAAEALRKAAVYALDSAYALPHPAPSIPATAQSLYSSIVWHDADALLVPETSVQDSEVMIEQARKDAEARREQSKRRAREKAELARAERRAREERSGSGGNAERPPVQLPAASSPTSSRLTSAIVKQSIGVAGLALAARKVSVTEEDAGLARLTSFVVSVDPMTDGGSQPPSASPRLVQLQPRPPVWLDATQEIDEGEEGDDGESHPSPAAAASPTSSSSTSPWEEAGLGDSDLPLSEEHVALFRLYYGHLHSCRFSAALWRDVFRAHKHGQPVREKLLQGGRADAAYRANEMDSFNKYCSLR